MGTFLIPLRPNEQKGGCEMNIHENTALLDAFLDGETTPEETAEVRRTWRTALTVGPMWRTQDPPGGVPHGRRMRSFRRILRKT